MSARKEQDSLRSAGAINETEKSSLSVQEKDTHKISQEQEQEQEPGKGPISPEVRANVVSRWTIWWLNDLFRTGFKRQIEEQDLYQIFERRRARVLGQLLFDNWEAEKLSAKAKQQEPSLLRAIIRSFWVRYLPGYLCLELGGRFPRSHFVSRQSIRHTIIDIQSYCADHIPCRYVPDQRTSHS